MWEYEAEDVVMTWVELGTTQHAYFKEIRGIAIGWGLYERLSR